MARIPLLQKHQAPEAAHRFYEEDEENYGVPLNTTRALAYSPKILEAARSLSRAVASGERIPAALRYLMNIRIAGLNGCPF